MIRDAIDNGAPNPRGHLLATISIVFGVVSAVLIIARWITRITVNRSIGSDDYVITLAGLMAITLTILYCQEAKYGFGIHGSDLTAAHKIQAMKTISLLMNTIGCSKYFFGAQILYKTSTCATKVSLLLLYLRIFTGRVFRTTAWGIIAVVIGYGTATVIATVFQCHPIAKAWDSRIHGHCINVGASWYATAAFAITTDIAIIVLPIKQISTLRLPRAQKLGLMFLFSLGTFVIATTAIRIVSLGPSTTSSDSTYYQAISNTWTDLEVNNGIICACLPTLKAPLVKFFPRLFSNAIFSSRSRKRSRTATAGYDVKISSERVRSQINPMNMARTKQNSASDEEIMLGSMEITKQTDIEVRTDAETSGERKSYIVEARSGPRSS